LGFEYSYHGNIAEGLDEEGSSVSGLRLGKIVGLGGGIRERAAVDHHDLFVRRFL
jgi:hypothetical protein